MSMNTDEPIEPRVVQEVAKRQREIMAALQRERTGRLNVYTCPAGHELVTVDLDQGVTPMLVKCREAGCGELAQSAFYRVDQSLRPTHEFYRPSARQVRRLDTETRYHVQQGGLLLREIERSADPSDHPVLAGARRRVLRGRRAIKIAASLGEKSTAEAAKLKKERRAAEERRDKKRKSRRAMEKRSRKAAR